MIFVLLPIILSALIIFAPVLILLAFIICFYILWKILKCPVMRIIKFFLAVFGILLIPTIVISAFMMAQYIIAAISDRLMPSPKETDNTTTTEPAK